MPDDIDNFAIDSLSSFNFSHFGTLKSKRNAVIKNLYIVRQPGRMADFDASIYSSLKKHLINWANCSLADQSSDKIYVTRKRAKQRKVLNEENFISRLIATGFKVYALEEYTFKEQIHLFANAKVLLSIHGAALTNMLFMPEHSKVIELQPSSNNPSLLYKKVADKLNIEHEICLVDKYFGESIYDSDLYLESKDFENICRLIDS